MIVCLHSYKGRAKTCHTAKNMTKTDTKRGVDVSRMGCFIHYIYIKKAGNLPLAKVTPCPYNYENGVFLFDGELDLSSPFASESVLACSLT